MTPIRIRVVAIALSIAFGSLGSAGPTHRSANDQNWTASDNDPGSASYYNFGQNGQALHRQPEGEKQLAISVRCIRDWPLKALAR